MEILIQKNNFSKNGKPQKISHSKASTKIELTSAFTIHKGFIKCCESDDSDSNSGDLGGLLF